MRTLRLSLAVAVILALPSGLTGMALAQDEDQWSGDWLEPTEEGVFGMAGHDLPMCALDKAEREAEYEPGGSGKEIRNLLFTCEVVFSDPRLSGTQTTRFTERGFSDGGYVNWGTMKDRGGRRHVEWLVPGNRGSQRPDRPAHRTHRVGAYEGLTNIRHASGGFWDALTQTGVIYSSDPPPVPTAE